MRRRAFLVVLALLLVPPASGGSRRRRDDSTLPAAVNPLEGSGETPENVPEDPPAVLHSL